MTDQRGDGDAGASAGNGSVHEQFLSDAVLNYDGADAPARRASARALLDRFPDLPRRSVWAAAAAGDQRALAGFLAADPSAARSAGGPRNWVPLLYLTYSRVQSDPTGDQVDRCLRLLLEAAADPNAGYLPDGVATPFTAVTGLFGGGEQDGGEQDGGEQDGGEQDGGEQDGGTDGGRALPAHPQLNRLAARLLSAGADPNDAQTLYNRMFGPADDHLELLFEHGLGTGDGGPWRRRNPDRTDTPEQLLRGQLAWAVTQGFTSRIAVLARHGVDLRAPLDAGWVPKRPPLTPLQLAVIAGRRGSAETLRELGVDDELDPATALVGALLDADTDTVGRLEIAHPGLLAGVRAEHPSLVLRAAVIDRPEAIETLVGRGFDVDALGRADTVIEHPWETALHHAAGAGKLETVRVLLRCGADRQITDRRYGAMALGWAHFFGQDQAVTLLA